MRRRSVVWMATMVVIGAALPAVGCSGSSDAPKLPQGARCLNAGQCAGGVCTAGICGPGTGDVGGPTTRDTGGPRPDGGGQRDGSRLEAAVKRDAAPPDAGPFCSSAACACLASVAGSAASRQLTVLRVDGTVTTLDVASFSQSVVTVFGGAPLGGLVRVVAAGTTHCGARSDGSVWCWGTGPSTAAVNGAGELGTGGVGPPNNTYEAARVLIGAGSPLAGAVEIGAGASTICAVRGDGSLWCWGAGKAGQLGRGGKSDSPYAAPVLAAPGGAPFDKVAAVTGGATHLCALRVDATVWCWGAGGAGQLGNGQKVEGLHPAKVTLGLGVAAVSSGLNHTCARTKNGEAWCWGSHEANQLGSASTDAPTPAPLQLNGANLGAVTDLHVGSGLGCASNGLGQLRCWGSVVNATTPTLYTNAVQGGIVTDAIRFGATAGALQNVVWYLASGGLLWVGEYQVPTSYVGCTL